MSDSAYAALKLLDKRRRADNREAASASFDEARELAKAAGFMLTQYTESHYRMEHRESSAVLDVWPGTQRLKAYQGRWPRSGSLPCPWSLVDLVNAVIQANKG